MQSVMDFYCLEKCLFMRIENTASINAKNNAVEATRDQVGSKKVEGTLVKIKNLLKYIFYLQIGKRLQMNDILSNSMILLNTFQIIQKIKSIKQLKVC